MQLPSDFTELAAECIERCRVIAGFTETHGCTTRTFLSPPMRECHAAISGWMEQVGLHVSVDAVGNLRGLRGRGIKGRLLIGSHLDTVPCAGAFDGVLGVCIALAILQALGDAVLDFDLEVIGFSEEEGVRFRTPFLGSLAATGSFDASLLALRDAAGQTMRDTIGQFGLDPAQIEAAQVAPQSFAYLEFHIEQGPVLEQADGSIAAVHTIAGQSRLQLTFTGAANHAGTTPMELRQDALSGAAEWITFVEQYAPSVYGLVATIGKLDVLPGASNVIPGQVCASLDVRHARDEMRLAAVRELSATATRIAARRGLECSFTQQLDQSAVVMDETLVGLIEKAVLQIGDIPRRMVSGAGHDAMIMARRLPSAMVFVHSVAGISHHPDEAVRTEDVAKAIHAGCLLIESLHKQRQGNQ